MAMPAMLIGMIPDMPLENVYAVGNAAGDGARIALLNLEKRRESAELARSVQRFELPTDPEFQTPACARCAFGAVAWWLRSRTAAW